MKPKEIFKKLEGIVGEKHLVVCREKLYHYAKDNSTGQIRYPIGVVKPASTKEVAMVVRFCNQIGQKIRVRAGGSSVSGGFISDENDLVLSVERLNNIVEINTVDRYAVVEAGVITQDLQNALRLKGLWFPQNISSASMCCIGGNVAISSGSPKSLKYGSTKNYVLNLEVVLPNGKVIWTGKNVKKNATGYNLTQLFVGSEGTLGIITQVVLEVVPPKKEVLLLVPFSNEKRLFQFVKDFFAQGHSASSLEFLDKNGCDLMYNYLKKKRDYCEGTGGLLWIEFESDSDEENLNKAEQLFDFVSNYTDFELFIAQTPQEIKTLWEFRKRIGEAAMNYGNFKDLDVVVPRSKIALMHDAIKKACSQLSLEFIIVGHIGDGNFHINIFKEVGLSTAEWQRKLAQCSNVLFKKAEALGGAISGEHGIGKHNKSAFLELVEVEKLSIMRALRAVFDPKRILNTDTLFLDDEVQLSTSELSLQY